MQLLYTEKARVDLKNGILWYAGISKSLGEAFLAEVETKLNFVKDNPQACKLAYKNYRVAILQRFPFSVFYSIEEDLIVIHAIFDNRQNPNKRP